MALTLTVTEGPAGVALRTDTVPIPPLLAPVTGENQLQVTWDRASGETSSDSVDLHIVFDAIPSIYLRFVDIMWGDATTTRISGLGRSVDVTLAHTYTANGPFTINVEVVTKIPDDLVFTETAQAVPTVTTDWAIDQVQVQRIGQEVDELSVDWSDLDRVALSYIDRDVHRGNAYKYRVRFRTLDGTGAVSTTSQYSAIASAGPWS